MAIKVLVTKVLVTKVVVTKVVVTKVVAIKRRQKSRGSASKTNFRFAIEDGQ
ncbi:MAG: hypothetical protein WAL80_21320 [Xanthobacteraceae bacterium]